jgi:hypothetical protein
LLTTEKVIVNVSVIMHVKTVSRFYVFLVLVNSPYPHLGPTGSKQFTDGDRNVFDIEEK